MSASADVFAVSAVTVARGSPYRVNSASKRRCDSFDQHLETPFDTKVLGVTVTVERIDMTDDEQIIAICRRGRSLQAIPILDLPLPKPRPAGVEWIEAYRCWAAGG